MTQDPFSKPTPRVSAFPSADSFRGRLILVEPLSVEFDVPKQKSQPNGAKGNKVTADVTTVDGLGPVQLFANYSGTGRWVEGPMHRKVWFDQTQIVDGLLQEDGRTLHKMVLMRVDTLNPGTRQGQGNPWTVTDPTEEDMQTARDFLAGRKVAQAAPPTAPPAAPQNPWAQDKAPF